MKVIWEVRNHTGKVVKSFAYPDKAEAEAAVNALTKSTGNTRTVAGEPRTWTVLHDVPDRSSGIDPVQTTG